MIGYSGNLMDTRTDYKNKMKKCTEIYTELKQNILNFKEDWVYRIMYRNKTAAIKT